jgi:hypothetical protein
MAAKAARGAPIACSKMMQATATLNNRKSSAAAHSVRLEYTDQRFTLEA